MTLAKNVDADDDRAEEIERHLARLSKTAPCQRELPRDERSAGSDAAGYTYLGQLITHDLFSPLRQERWRPSPSPDGGPGRTLDLTSVYGVDPSEEADLYRFDGEFRLGDTYPVGSPPTRDDLTTDHGERSLLAAPRNDHNLLLSQLHVAFLKLHNQLLRWRYRQPATGDPWSRVREIRGIAVSLYRAVVIHEYLPAVSHPEHLGWLMESDPGVDRWGPSPMELALLRGAALRFGHSQIRSTYVLNPVADGPVSLQRLLTFRGRNNRRLRSDWLVDWRRFFPFPGDLGRLNLSKPVDACLEELLFAVPPNALPDERGARSVPLRDLLASGSLPSGQAMARDLRIEAVEGPLPGLDDEVNEHTPLWLYLLAEANRFGDGGRHLGPLGTQLVARPLLRLVRWAELREGHRGHDWAHEVFGVDYAELRMRHLLEFAGVADRFSD